VARRHYDRGTRANDSGRPVPAARALRAALAALDAHHDGGEGDALRVRVLLAQALAEFELAGTVASDPLLDEALVHATRLGDAELQALVHSQRAMALGRSGRMAPALAELDLAVRLLDRLEPRDQWVVTINRGMVRSHLFDLAGARRDFARARDVARAAAMADQEFMATHNLGYAAYLAGDMPAALQLMAEAERLTSDVWAPARLDRGRVLLEAGLASEAEAMLTSALEVCTDRRQRQVRGEIELDLARARWAVGRDADAVRLARAAERRFARRQAPLWADRARLLGLQISLSRKGSVRRVAAEAGALADRAGAEGDALLSAHASLIAAQALVSAGDLTGGSRRMAAAAPMRPVASLSTRLSLDLVEARVATARGQVRTAGTVLRRAARDLRRAQGTSASLDLRTATAVHGRRLAELDLRLAVERGPTAVLAVSERWRAATASMPSITPPADPELARLLIELRGVQERVREDPSGDRESLRAQESRVRERIRLRDWQLRDTPAARAERRLDRSALRTALAARDATLVSHFVLDGAVHEVAVVGGRARLRHVGAVADVTSLARRTHADLQAYAAHGAGPLGGTVRASLERGLAALDALLLADLPAGALVVAPTSATSLIPWNLLPSRRGLPTTVATSARAWLAGDTVLDEPRVAVVVGPGLPHALDEGADVSDVWGAARPGAQESVDVLRAAFMSSDLVHVAAHGRHEPQSPLFSSLRMADGPLSAHELANSGVRAAHVVLSACDVGQATLRPGDEPLGLSACLLYLGAASVVAPVCRVPDAVAAEAMTAYHRRLREGLEAAEALAVATEEGDLLGRAFTVVGAPVRVSRAQ
jgi:tetratricopeptide (TPR) repeat protein